MAIRSVGVTPQIMEGGYTCAKKNKILYKWKVKNISSLLEPTQDESIILVSSEFSTRSTKNNKWRLIINFNNGPSSTYAADYLTLFLDNRTDQDINVDYSFYFLNIKYEKLFVIDAKDILMKSWKMDGKHFVKIDLLAKKSELMPYDTLTVCADVIVYDNKQKVPFEVSIESSEGSLADYLQNLSISNINSDVTIIIEDQRFEANKAILSARCPVLATMITHDLTEKATNQVFITDIAPEIFKKLLEYIYTDQVTDLDLVAVELLEVADKYKLQSLKKICEVSLCKMLNCDNAIDFMNLAERHDATNLFDYVIKCIKLGGENILKSEGFKKIDKSSMVHKFLNALVAIDDENEMKVVHSS